MSGESTAPLEIEEGAANGTRIVRVRGELDLTNASALEDALTDAGSTATVLDLSGLVFVDSAGIRAIDSAYKRLRQADHDLVIVAPPDSRAGWTFRVAGFDSDFVLDSIEAATQIAGRRSV